MHGEEWKHSNGVENEQPNPWRQLEQGYLLAGCWRKSRICQNCLPLPYYYYWRRRQRRTTPWPPLHPAPPPPWPAVMSTSSIAPRSATLLNMKLNGMNTLQILLCCRAFDTFNFIEEVKRKCTNMYIYIELMFWLVFAYSCYAYSNIFYLLSKWVLYMWIYIYDAFKFYCGCVYIISYWCSTCICTIVVRNV